MSAIMWLLILLALATLALVTHALLSPPSSAERCALCGGLVDEEEGKYVCPECGQEWEG